MKFKPIYIWFAAPAAVIIAWVLVFYMPMSTRIKAKEREAESLKQQVQTVGNDIKNVLEGKKKNEDMKRGFTEVQTQIPSSDELPDFMKEIVRAARSDGVVFDSFNSMLTPAGAGEKSPITHPVFDIGLKGRFPQIGRFLEWIADKRAYASISRARITYDDKEYPVLTGRFVVEFKAWREKKAF